MQCILCKIYFWKVFHKYYNLICAPICTKSFILFFFCKKWVLQLLFLFLSWVLKIIVFSYREWQCSKQESYAHWELLIVDPRRHEFTWMNLSASPLPGEPLSMVCHQIFRVVSEGMQVDKINLR
jgi:hypothetical protein